MRCHRKLLNITYKDHVTNGEVRNKIHGAIGNHDDLLSVVKKGKLGWLYLKSLWHDKDNSARDSKRNKKERKTEKVVGREHRGLEGIEFGESVRAVEDTEG